MREAQARRFLAGEDEMRLDIAALTHERRGGARDDSTREANRILSRLNCVRQLPLRAEQAALY